MFRLVCYYRAKSIQKTEINDEEVEGEIFEMLYTFTDFIRFKQMFLDYRAVSWYFNIKL